MARHRSRSQSHQTGYKQWYSRNKPSGSPTPAAAYTSRYETCVDDLDPSAPYDEPHNLDLSRWDVSPVLATGHPYGGWGYVHAPIALSNYNAILPSTVTWDYWFTKAIANYNPNVPALDLPLFLFEFKDFPHMLKHAGEFLSAGVKASNYLATITSDAVLAWNFGWKPLISDLTTLVSLGHLIDARLRQLRAMERRKKVRRFLGRGKSSYPGADVYIGVGASNGNYHTRIDEEYEVWFVSKPYLYDPHPGRAPDLWEQCSQILGLEVSYSTMWNMIPWSWLIDYFWNIGTFLEAHRGNVRWAMGKTFVMYHETRKRVMDIQDLSARNPSYTYTGGIVKVESKKRQYRHNPSPRLAMEPFLTPGHMANLGALLTSDAFSKWKYF